MTTTTEAAIPITEVMIEAACRAAVAVAYPNADADLRVPHPNKSGITCTIWEACRLLIEPALKAALDRDTIPVGHVVVPVEPPKDRIKEAVQFALRVSLSSGYFWPDYMRDLYRIMIDAAAPQSKEAE